MGVAVEHRDIGNGIVVTLHDPPTPGAGSFDLVPMDPVTPPRYVTRAVIKLEIEENGVKFQGNYPGKVMLQVGYYTSEVGYRVFLYDDSGNMLKKFPTTGTPELKNPVFPNFAGYFLILIDEDEFPDPNIGVGP